MTPRRYDKIIVIPAAKNITLEAFKEKEQVLFTKKHGENLLVYSLDKSNIVEEKISLSDEKNDHLPFLEKIKETVAKEFKCKSVEDQRSQYEKINDGIEDSFSKIEQARGQDLILVIGLTGAGKSTTVNYLLRYPMTEDDEGQLVPVDSSIKPPAKMGDSASSITTYPATYALSGEEFVYCDCPGFKDNRDRETRVCVSLNTESTVKMAKSISAAIVVIEWGTFSSRLEGFKDLALILGNLFSSAEQSETEQEAKSFNISKSLLFIITKAPSKIKHAACVKKIESGLEALGKRLEDEKSKLTGGTESYFQSMSSSLVKKITGERGGSEKKLTEDDEYDKQQKIVEDLSLQIYMMNLMKENKDNIILADVLDNGETRNLIKERLRKMSPIPAEAMNFNNSDSVRRLFCEETSLQMQQAVQHIKRKSELPVEIKKHEAAQRKIEGEIKNYQDQIEDIDSGRVFKGEEDPIVIDNKNKIKENIEEIAAKKEAIEGLEEKLNEANQQLWALDTSDEVLFYDTSKKKRRVSALGDAMTLGIKDMGLIDFTSALVVSPLTSLYGGLRRLSHDIEYNGQPFTRAETICRNGGKVETRVNKPEEGQYKAHYQSDRGRAGIVELRVYGQKRNKPENKLKIEELKSTIQYLKAQKKEAANAIPILEDTNRKLVNFNEEFIKSGKKNLKQTKKKVEGIITMLSSQINTIQGSIKASQEELNREEVYCKEKLSFWTIIGKLSAFIDFKPKQLVKEFINSLIESGVKIEQTKPKPAAMPARRPPLSPPLAMLSTATTSSSTSTSKSSKAISAFTQRGFLGRGSPLPQPTTPAQPIIAFQSSTSKYRITK